ncbi:cytochrome c oxidase cbb3-type subunit 4 [Collimonas sp. OK242]|jgi:cytochrome c oxidase cbb3-type subunit 4|uniref:cbb3-type cytochrome oxidase subunit 3 n=1 Tax=Collimonas sp. OK242 TaxID=1798195 RepID=UPI000897191C|nr:CcoQ/FixQ family Cbb3-type cytochrome c oxidase assembly chaperone [Collimonas sp. OK242]SDX40992.1 cytochrome c oxidase cbb3-type subunit 4 [Collimonas sp. OK242]
MAIQKILIEAHSIITLISFVTFIGIVWWSYFRKQPKDFDEAALSPFADDQEQLDKVKAQLDARERHHG